MMFTSKCAQIILLQLPKLSKLYSTWNKFSKEKPSGGRNNPPPLVARGLIVEQKYNNYLIPAVIK